MFRKLLLAGLCLFAGPVCAQSAPGSAPVSSRGIWDFDLDGTAIHQQSKLTCPNNLADFKRTKVQALNPAGLDAACGYSGSAGEISIFITKYGEAYKLPTAFEDAKKAVLQTWDAVERSDPLDKPGSFPWLEASYTIQSGKTYSDLLMVSLSEWVLQIRASYNPAQKAAVADALKLFAATVSDTAYPYLAACGASGEPARAGLAIRIQGKALLAVALSGINLASEFIDDPATGAQWCAESGIVFGEKPHLYWRNVGADVRAGIDRIVPIEGRSRLVVVPDEKAEAIVRESFPDFNKRIFDLFIDTQTEKYLVGIYEGRPTLDVIAKDASSRPYAAFNKAKNSVEVSPRAFGDK